MAELRRRRSERLLGQRPRSHTAGLDAVAESHRVHARVLDDVATASRSAENIGFEFGAQKAAARAMEDANGYTFTRNAAEHQLNVDGQSITVRDENAVVMPELPDPGSVSIYDREFHQAMVQRYLTETDATTRTTLSTLANQPEMQNDPTRFARTADEYRAAVVEKAHPSVRGLVDTQVARVTGGLYERLHAAKADRDYKAAERSSLDALARHRKDLTNAWRSGSTATLVTRDADGGLVEETNHDLADQYREFASEVRRHAEAFRQTPEWEREQLEVLDSQVALAQLGKMIPRVGSDPDVYARDLAKLSADVSSGDVEIQLPVLVNDGRDVEFKTVKLGSYLGDVPRQELAGTIRDIGAEQGQYALAVQRIEETVDAQVVGTVLEQMLLDRISGNPVDQEAALTAAQRLEDPRQRNIVLGAVISSINADRAERSRQREEANRKSAQSARETGWEIDQLSYEQMLGQLEQSKGFEKNPGHWLFNAEVIEMVRDRDRAGSDPTYRRRANELMRRQLAFLQEVDHAGAKEAVRRTEVINLWGSPGDPRGGTVSQARTADAIVAGMIETRHPGALGDEGQLTPKFWKERPQQGLAAARATAGMPPSTLTTAMSQLLASGEPQQMELGLAYYDAMLSNPSFEMHAATEAYLGPKASAAYEFAHTVTKDTGFGVSDEQILRRTGEILRGQDGADSRLQAMSVEARRDFFSQVRSAVVSDPLIGKRYAPERMISTITNLTIGRLAQIDITDGADSGAVRRAVRAITGQLQAGSEWGTTRIVVGDDFGHLQEGWTAATDYWARNPPSKFYPGVPESVYIDSKTMHFTLARARENEQNNLGDAELELGKNVRMRFSGLDPQNGRPLWSLYYLTHDRMGYQALRERDGSLMMVDLYDEAHQGTEALKDRARANADELRRQYEAGRAGRYGDAQQGRGAGAIPRTRFESDSTGGM